MKFRTEYQAKKSTLTLDPDIPVLMLGSCFADNMATRMRSCLWDASNPFGTLYNPASIAHAITATDREIEESVFETDGLVKSWLFDSRIMSETAKDTIQSFTTRREEFFEKLKTAQALFVTFGTSWVYELMSKPGYVVANCHKMPPSMFCRRRLSVGEIVCLWRETIEMLREVNPELELVFTVSPVRHLKDGFEGNTRSKAVLQLSVEEICGSVEKCSYFPAYEILNDDLRDYRYYNTDLVHPSAEGVEYIWEKFRETYIDASGEASLREGERLVKAAAHRPLPSAVTEPSESWRQREAERLTKLSAALSAFASAHPHRLTPPVPTGRPSRADVTRLDNPPASAGGNSATPSSAPEGASRGTNLDR